MNKSQSPIKSIVETPAQATKRAAEELDRHRRVKKILIFGLTLALVCLIRGDFEMLAEVVALQGTLLVMAV